MSHTAYSHAPRLAGVTHGTESGPALPAGLRAGWERPLATLRLWHQRARERRELRRALRIHAALGGEPAVHDLGALPGELRREAGKPFWRR